jgi:hypothetical protein
VYVYRFDGEDWKQQAYVKASNTEAADYFGNTTALSEDGNTLAVGAREEDSNAIGINGDQNDNSATDSGAVYLFQFEGTIWLQQAYIKASNTGVNDGFGDAVAVSVDGNTLAIGTEAESSNATGINGDENDDSAPDAGAAYVFRFDGIDWNQQAYVKSSNTQEGNNFGIGIAMSGDGSTLATGAATEEAVYLY